MKILTNDGISQHALATLEKAGFEVLNIKVAQEQLENYINETGVDALLIGSSIQIQQELIDNCPSIKLIGSTQSNSDNIDVQYAEDQGIHVINSSEAGADSIAELVFAHLLGMVRHLHQSNREMPLEGDSNFRGLKKLYKGNELKGKTLGIIGMNSVGIATAKIALGLGMKVIIHDLEVNEISVEFEFFDGQTTNFQFISTEINELFKNSDFISVNVLAQDVYLIGENQFDKMKDGVGFINCTQGGIVDEIALVNAIESGKVKYAALDVFENEPNPEIQLLMNTSLSLSPNIGSATFEAEDKISIELATKVIELLS